VELATITLATPANPELVKGCKRIRNQLRSFAISAGWQWKNLGGTAE
jgi:hypothetical protein